MPGGPSLWPPGIPRDLSPCSVAEGRWLPAGVRSGRESPGLCPSPGFLGRSGGMEPGGCTGSGTVPPSDCV